MKRMSTLTSEKRNDLHLTSTGVALARRHSAPALDLPPLPKPLHSSLPVPSRLSPSLTVPTADNVYQTTTVAAYDHKDMMYPVLIRKAPGLGRVNYMLQTLNKFESRPWRRSLTMANQKSEMRAKYMYCGHPDMISRVLPVNDPQPTALSDHFSEGPTKDLVPSTTVKRSAGRECRAQNVAVLDKNQPYLTTNHRFHHGFSEQEQCGYARKDAATYWLCEDYPKAWGHGTKDNPLTTPTYRSERGPMRDRTVFRTGTSIRRLPPSIEPLSQGYHTVYSDTHTAFHEDEKQQLFHCPVQSSAHTQGYDSSIVQFVPQMYRTGNMMYGTTVTPPSPQAVE